MADVMKLADGSNFSPQLIENKLKFSPYIMDAVVIGQDQPFISAMVVHRLRQCRQMGRKSPDRLHHLRRYVAEGGGLRSDCREGKTNETLPRVAKVRRFVLLYKELDADDEELTRTRKVRRNFVIKRYQDLVNALYGDRDELNIEANIRYRDGSSYRMKTLVRIREVESTGLKN